MLCLRQVLTIPILGLLSAIWPLAVFAGEYTPWGITLSDGPLRAAVAPPDANPMDVARKLEATRESVLSDLRELGPYSPALANVLLSAAREAEEYRANEQALTWYRQALFTIRVSQGLYAPGQLPVLERMLFLLREQGDPEALAKRIDYFYHLMGQGTRPYSNDRLEASVLWLAVNIELLAKQSATPPFGRLLEIWEHGDNLAEDVCADDHWSSQWCKPLSLQLLALLYVIDYYIDPLVTEQYGVTTVRSQTMNQRSWDLSPAEQRLQTLEASATSRARQVLERALAATPDDSELVLARADWAWFKGKRGQALEDYRQLRQGNTSMFATPTPLPAVPVISRDTRLIENSYTLATSATITSYGRPQDVVVTGLSERELSQVDYASRKIRELRFRPVLDAEGEPVEAEWSSPIVLMR